MTFGSSYPKARKAFENIEEKVRQSYPNTPVRWAYTSKIIRNKLAKEGIDLDSPAEALAKMADQGFTRVAVQSLHIIRGCEYHDLRSVVQGFRFMQNRFDKILIGSPLLNKPASLERVKKVMLENIPEERNPDEAVVFMGHGTHHPSNAFYQAMAYKFQQSDPLVYLGTVEGAPKLQAILADLKKKNVKRIYLLPFMSVAGDHARNDLAGNSKNSWKSILQSKGYQVKTVLKGMAEYDNVVRIWLESLQKSISHFEER